MNYTKEEVMQYISEEDVEFIRLAFCDVFGRRKNVSITPGEMERAFEYGIAFDASSIAGFGNEAHSDLFMHPDPDTLILLPWRPEHGRVVRMFADVTYPDGRPFECDTRTLLKKAVGDAKEAGVTFSFGIEQEFYLFELDDDGQPTKKPYDRAGYMDMAPDDKGENIRREICLMLEQMGIYPESSHHEDGPGQNEIDFRYSDALSAADNAMSFRRVVKTVAARNGLWADFSPRPLENAPGSGFHINLSVQADTGEDLLPSMIAGILRHIGEITVFLNPLEGSYTRLGRDKAPRFITWSAQNRSQLIRVPAAEGEFRRAELRSPDPAANPYLAYALLIWAAMDGIAGKLSLPPAADLNLFTADQETQARFARLPESKEAAAALAASSGFLRAHLPRALIDSYCV